MNNVAELSEEQRNELFKETATVMKTTTAIIEKDFWVVWTLNKLYSDDRLNKILMFKGGTSLSILTIPLHLVMLLYDQKYY